MRTLIAILILAAACGGNSSGGGDAGGDNGDGGGTMVDARFPSGCTMPDTTKPQCSNCIDDDMDGTIDGYDIECTGPLDNDENSFATGIAGDNIDPVLQECFFDGDSGQGNDGCNIHVCCILGAQNASECPFNSPPYNKDQCPPPIGTTPLSQMCKDFCRPLTPPGCDCFGCCTLCDESGCYDIATNPATSPECTDDTLADETKCKRCTKVSDCGNTECGGSTCILCPGQDPSTLPAECNGTTTCPDGVQSCTTTACPDTQYCSNGCCINIIM